MISINEYYSIINDKEFKKDSTGKAQALRCEHDKYFYRGCIIDYYFDEPKESEEFNPFYKKGFNRLTLGDAVLVDYSPSVLYVRYKNDIEKYKDIIISYIDLLNN